MLNKIYELVETFYNIHDRTALNIILAAYFSSKIPLAREKEPLWLVIIAPPASGKTELLRMFTGLKSSYWLSSLTQYSLISGNPGKDTSLIPRIKNKVVLVKEMSTLDSMEKNKREEILGILRDAYDGFTSKEFAWGRREYKNVHFNLLGCTTYNFEINSATRSTLGERFLSLRLKTGTLGTFENIAETRKQLNSIVQKLDNTFNENHNPSCAVLTDTEKQHVQIAARLKTTIPRNSYTKHIELVPPPDSANRLAMQLIILKTSAYKLGLGAEETENMLNRILIDYIPKNRLSVIEAILNGHHTTSDIAEYTHLGKTTTSYVLQDLRILGAISEWKKRKKIVLSADIQNWLKGGW